VQKITNNGLAEVLELKKKSITGIKGLGKSDNVFCVAVLIEIQDIFRSIEALKFLTGGQAFVPGLLCK
jgi:hypothetical protein